MKSFILLSVIAYALAQSDTCPNGLAPQQGPAGISFCCPSGMTANDPTGTYCVLGCQKGFMPCFPMCTDPGTTNAQTTSGVCTSVPVTASNYSQLVGLATASSAAPTNSASTQTGTTSATGVTQTGSASSSATATTSTTSSSSRNAGAMMTAAPLLVVGAIAGAVIV